VPALWGRHDLIAVLAFVALAMLQNVWRPMLLTRFEQCTDNAMRATLLSVDSQAKSIFTMVAAPLLGLAVDHMGLWSVGALGVLALAPLLLGMYVAGHGRGKADPLSAAAGDDRSPRTAE